MHRMQHVYRPQHRSPSSPRMAAARQSPPSSPSVHSSTGSLSPRETVKAAYAIDMIEAYRNSKFVFQECFEDCARLKKQLEASTGGWRNNKELAKTYAIAQTRMVEEFSSLLSTCHVHANLYNLENNSIHGDVKVSTNCMNECFDLIQTSFGSKMQDEDDFLSLKNALPKHIDSRTHTQLQQDLKSSIEKIKKDLNLPDDFIKNLIENEKDLVLNSMNQQTPSSKHSKILFKNILNLYEIEYAQFLARNNLELVQNSTVCLSQEL